MYSEWSPDDPHFDEYEIFSDGENHDFKSLEASFPGSRFILTSRRLDDWLVSRVRHIEFRRAVNKSGWMRKEFESGPRDAIKRWVEYRAQYHAAVYSHFASNTDRLLSLNLCDSTQKSVALQRLLEFAGLPADITDKFPHKRKTNDVVGTLGSDIKRLLLGRYRPRNERKIRVMVEGVLTDMNINQSEWGDDGLAGTDISASGVNSGAGTGHSASTASTQK